MSIKNSIGLRIKTERESQQMSREVLCLDGKELTVRQLIRIEKGESLPSLDKLSYIAKRLEKSMADLLDHDRIEIPDTYYEMKNRLIKFPTYGDKERIKQKLDLIEEALEEYFSILPEEELLTLELLENILSFTEHENGPKTEEIFEDVFLQAQQKKKLSINDLLVVQYYFLQIYDKKHQNPKVFDRISRKILNQEISSDDVYNIVLLSSLMGVSTIYSLRGDYKLLLPATDMALIIIERTQQFTYKPGVLVMRAKYFKHYEGNIEQANKYYDEAIAFASFLGDTVLEKGLRAERETDGL